jgi:hypothetical protein
MIRRGWARTNINKHLGRLKLLSNGAPAKNFSPASVYPAIATVGGVLRRVRTEARETEPVRPVPKAMVEAILHVDQQCQKLFFMIDFWIFTPSRHR